MLAASLGRDDRVALEVSGGAWAIVAILERHVARVVVVSPGDTGIAQARAKTDRLDARRRGCCGRGSLRGYGHRMSSRACCAGGWRAGAAGARSVAGQERDPRGAMRCLVGP
jgi:hypothetical protein